MLYAEHLLSRFDALGREGAVLRSLDKPQPPTLHELYETLLKTCHRHTSTAHQDLTKFLLHFIAYAFRAINLLEVESLLKQLTGDEEFGIEELPETFSYFLRVGDPGADSEERAKIQAQGGWGTRVQDLESSQTNSPDKIYNDGRLHVKFRERSMRTFFRNSNKDEAGLHWSPSEAHRQIFLTTSKITDMKLMIRKYATHYPLKHWMQINADEHTAEEQAEVMEMFYTIMTDKAGHAELIQLNESWYKDIFAEEGFSKLPQWTKLVGTENGPQLSEDAGLWWAQLADGPENCLMDLAKAHLRAVYEAPFRTKAVAAYKILRSALDVVS